MDLTHLPDKELKAMVIKMFTRIERMDELREDFNKKRENLKKKINQR